MNDEYLWEKTGDDPEIRRLEDALVTFRYRESSPPALPITEAREPRSLRFTLTLAFAALATIIVAPVVWFQIDAKRGDNEALIVSLPTTETHSQTAVEATPITDERVESTKQPVLRGPRRINTTTPAKRMLPIRTHSKKTGTTVLTREERYAYEQLMLALSISSSKLKIVQNAINGIDDTEDPRQNNR